MTRNKSQPARPMPIVRLHGKLFGSFGFGIVVTVALLPVTWPLTRKMLAGWDAFVLLYLVQVYAHFWRSNLAQLRKRAAEEDEGAVALLGLSCLASFISLAAIVAELGSLQDAAPFGAALPLTISMATIVLSWAFVHTSFALHYAHEFYGEGRDRKIGGLKFPGDRQPNYWDFLYFSLVIAMTSQVSDVAVESKPIRRIVTVHGVLAFFFNLGVLALTINMMSNLIS
jgi:uncharacterized membrane protein